MLWLRLQIHFHLAQHQRMAQRDKIPGPFGGLNPGDAGGGKDVALMVATVDNHRQGLRQHGDERFRARLAHRFRFGGDVDHMRFASGVYVGQLRHSLFL